MDKIGQETSSDNLIQNLCCDKTVEFIRTREERDQWLYQGRVQGAGPGTGTGAQEKVETLLGWSSAPGHSSLLARLLLSGSSQEGWHGVTL